MADTTISQLPIIVATGNTVIPVSYNGVTYQIAVSSAIDTIGVRTGSLKLPTGTTAQRENITGAIRYNSEYGSIEFYNGSAWQLVPSTSQNVIEYLIIGGGGAGGRNGYGAGGGGAGGYIYGTNFTLTPGTQYPITVGVGGAKLSYNGSAYTTTINNGTDSSFLGFVAKGGGGGSSGNVAGGSGGSGGGGNGGYYFPSYAGGYGGAGTLGQGNAGGNSYYAGGGDLGYYAGGGGGASSIGLNGNSNPGRAGDGGNGVVNSITGTATTYAGGGGGGASYYTGGNGGQGGGGTGGGITNDYNGVDGVDGRGSGGGGGGSGTLQRSGGKGGNGIVIIAYPGTVSRATVVNGVTDTSIRPGYVVHTFGQNGNITWIG